MAARRRALLAAVLLVSSLALRAAAPELAGIWTGSIEREGAPLAVELAFESRDGRLQGWFSSAPLRAIRIPLSDVKVDAATARWKLVGDATTMEFEGILDAESLAGRLREGAAGGSFALRRADATAFPAREEEIGFANGAVRLSGTVLWPRGDGPFPGVVFLHGSGAEGRWGSRYLAYEFARAGIAALVYDKRGVGRSGGDWRTAAFEELVGDASAAVEALRARPGVDPRRVGIHGHSQGGTISPWVAVENANVAFVVASAAAGVSMADAEIFSLENHVEVDRLPAEEQRLARRYVRAVVAAAYEGAPREALEEARREAQGRPWIFPIPADDAPYWRFSRRIAGYDALAWWRRVQAPALLVYGEQDQRVPVRESIARIERAAARPPDVIVFAGADHGFRVRRAAAGFAWPQNAAGYPDRVVEWVLRVTRR